MKKFRDFCLGQPFLTIVILSAAFAGGCGFAAAHLPALLPRMAVILGLFLVALLFLRSRFHHGLQTAGRENMARLFAHHPRANRAADLLPAPFRWWEKDGLRFLGWTCSALAIVFMAMSIHLVYLFKVDVPRQTAAATASIEAHFQEVKHARSPR